jgi:hypothetical protein
MSFRAINPHNIQWMVPSWAASPFQLARALDDLLVELFKVRRRPRWDASLDFWVIVEIKDGSFTLDLREVDESGNRQDCGILFLVAADWVINLPLNDLLKGAPRADGTHCLYYHWFDSEVPAAYTGLSKQRWFDRYAQHLSSARNGSPYLFHRAIREHGHKRAMHKVMMGLLTQEQAYHYEEEMVSRGTLYPLGLNMIPGGLAGIRYLHNLGVKVASAESRDTALEMLATQTDIAGKPNPLCAARWETDPDFNARVICGHSGRLTADQVRSIRMLSSFGMSTTEIASRIDDSDARVSRVLSGKRYGRVK